MSPAHALIDSLPSFSRFIRRIITPGEFSPQAVSVISITVILLTYFFDMESKENVRLGVLYLFPVFMMSLHNGRTRESLLLMALAILCQTTSILSFNIPIAAKIIESIIKPLSIVLVFLLSIELREMHLMIMDIANKDGLTGLLSRKSFEFMLDQEMTRQKRYGGVFSLALMLGRVRASVEQELKTPPLGLNDSSLTALHSSYGAFKPRMEPAGTPREWTATVVISTFGMS